MPDPIFADRRLAEIYDPLDPVRDDLDVYASIVAELGAKTVLDVGCGTGTFACLLAERGIEVVGVDPAGASLDVARRTDIPGVGVVETWCDVTSVDDDLVTFRWTHVFESDGTVLASDSTLRFRSREAVEQSLLDSGFLVDEVREAPDRPGRELVFIASRRR